MSVDTKPRNSGSRGRTPIPANELRRTQFRILEALRHLQADPEGGIQAAVTIDQIAERARVSVGMIRRGLGAVNPSERAAHDAHWGHRSLVTRAMVKVLMDGERGAV